MNPEISVIEESGDERGFGGEYQGGNPDDHSSKDIHRIGSVSIDPLMHKTELPIGRIKVINAQCPFEGEVLLYGIERVDGWD